MGPRPSQEVRPLNLDQIHRGTNPGTDRASTQLQCSTGWGSVKSQFTSSSDSKGGAVPCFQLSSQEFLSSRWELKLGLRQLNAVAFPAKFLKAGCALGPKSWNAGRLGNNHKASVNLIYFWETSNFTLNSEGCSTVYRIPKYNPC